MVRLFYRGRGCGGVMLPFESAEAAESYERLRYATSYRIEGGHGEPLVIADRADCRHKFIRHQGVAMKTAGNEDSTCPACKGYGEILLEPTDELPTHLIEPCRKCAGTGRRGRRPRAIRRDPV